MAFTVDFAARTDVGLVRSRNEDSGYAGPHLLAVADGMGGHAGGNVASSLVLARLAPLDGDSHGSDDALVLLAETIRGANASLAQEMADNAELQGMGTTLTALMRAGTSGLALVHIGDSRAYLLRDGRFTQITKDHSFVQSLVDSGRISGAEAEHHPQRSLVTRVLTGSADDEPDLTMREARIGDRYLICSDGLSDYVAHDTISEVISAGLSPKDTTKRLIDLALRSGAPDNVTCVVGDLLEPSASPPTHPAIVGAAAERTRARDGRRKSLSPAAKAAALRREVTGGAASDEGVVLAEEEESPRRRWVRLALLPLVALLLVAGGTAAGYAWSQQQVFIGEHDGRVAVYQGVSQMLGPITLFSLKQATDIPVDDLPDFYRQSVRSTINASSEQDALLTVDKLRAQRNLCVAMRARGTACGSPGAAATATDSATASVPPSVPGASAPGSGLPESPSAAPATSAALTTLRSSATTVGFRPEATS